MNEQLAVTLHEIQQSQQERALRLHACSTNAEASVEVTTINDCGKYVYAERWWKQGGVVFRQAGDQPAEAMMGYKDLPFVQMTHLVSDKDQIMNEAGCLLGWLAAGETFGQDDRGRAYFHYLSLSAEFPNATPSQMAHKLAERLQFSPKKGLWARLRWALRPTEGEL